VPIHTDPVTTVKRYTLCGEVSAEARVAQDLSRIAAGLFSDIGDRMRALVLVGSFARAEGGVLYLDDEPHADPGYQLLALFDRRPRREQRLVRELAATWTRLLRTQVDVRAFSVGELARTPRTLFWYHVGCGQRVTLIGDPTAIFAVPPRSSSELDPDAPVRLLTEATVALSLTSLRRDAKPDALLDRLRSTTLACGDAALLLRGIYHPSLRARAQLLSENEPCEGLAELYDTAVRHRAEARLTPDGSAAHAQRELLSLRERLARIQLELEAQRIGSPRDPVAYARSPSRYDASSSPSLNRLSALLQRATSERPASRLLRAAVALGYDQHNSAARAAAAQLLHLGSRECSDETLADALRALARRVLHDPEGHPFAHWRTEPRSLGEWLAQRISSPEPLHDAMP
jgi:hypothetical protein